MKKRCSLIHMDGGDPSELEFTSLKGALLALNTVFEAARIGKSGMLNSAWAADIEDLVEAAGEFAVQE